MRAGAFDESTQGTDRAAHTQAAEDGDGDGEKQGTEGQQNRREGVAGYVGEQFDRFPYVPDRIDNHISRLEGRSFIPADAVAEGRQYKPPATERPGVPRDTSLDEFASDGESDGATPDDGADTTDAGKEGWEETATDEGTGTPNDGASDPPETEADRGSTGSLPTHEWTPSGAPCDRCGTPVSRRWRGESGDAMVCDDCKEW